MGMFSRKAKVDPADLVALHDELQAVRARLDAAELAKQMLEAHVQMLSETSRNMTNRVKHVDELAARMSEVDDLRYHVARLDGVNAKFDGVNAKVAALDALDGRIAELAEKVTASANDAKSAKDQAATLNERISNVSTELANQLSELSRELDDLGNRPAPAAEPVLATDQTVTEEMLEELYDAQVRLAAEQARYQIAFRQDLATIADQLKRPRS